MQNKNDIINDILKENKRRREDMFAPFNPITGEGSIGERTTFSTPDYPIPEQLLPVEMMDEPLVKALEKAGTVQELIKTELGLPLTDEAFEKVVTEFTRLRSKYDFPFWAATFAYIKRKGGGQDMLFRLNRPQRKLIGRLEMMRKDKKPIRLILLKARQWGGSVMAVDIKGDMSTPASLRASTGILVPLNNPLLLPSVRILLSSISSRST